MENSQQLLREVKFCNPSSPSRPVSDPPWEVDCLHFEPRCCQGQILAVWILAAKLPNAVLNFAMDFAVDFFLLFFLRKKAPKNPPKNPPQNSPGHLARKIPLGFLQKPFLEFLGPKNGHLGLQKNWLPEVNFFTFLGPTTTERGAKGARMGEKEGGGKEERREKEGGMKG